MGFDINRFNDALSKSLHDDKALETLDSSIEMMHKFSNEHGHLPHSNEQYNKSDILAEFIDSTSDEILKGHKNEN